MKVLGTMLSRATIIKWLFSQLVKVFSHYSFYKGSLIQVVSVSHNMSNNHLSKGITRRKQSICFAPNPHSLFDTPSHHFSFLSKPTRFFKVSSFSFVLLTNSMARKTRSRCMRMTESFRHVQVFVMSF